MITIPSINTIRGDFGTAVEVEAGLWRIRLNNPLGALTVNSYLWHNNDKTVIFDPGWPHTLPALKEAIAATGFGTLDDIDAFLYTHTHPDHMGLAAILSAECNAKHFVPGTIANNILDHWHVFMDDIGDWASWEVNALAGEAREEARQRRAAEPVEKRRFMVPTYGDLPIQNRVTLCDNDVFEVCGEKLHWFYTPGHDRHHGVFYNDDADWIITGDVILATPTPFFTFLGDDVAKYMSSISRIERIGARMLLPGHGSQRAGELVKLFDLSRGYVYEMEDSITMFLRARGINGLYEIAMATSEGNEAVRRAHRWLWYLARVEAVVFELCRRGKVEKEDDDGPLYRWRG